MKECKHCKTQNKDDYIYCMNCGRKLSDEQGSRSIPALKGVELNKKTIIIAAAILALLAGGIFWLTSSGSGGKKTDYLFQQDKVQLIQGDSGLYLFEGSTKKAELEGVTAKNTRRSLDNKTLLIQGKTEEENNIYVYKNGSVDLISGTYDSYTLSDSGDVVYYTDAEDGSVHLYQVKNKSDKAVVTDEEAIARYGDHVLSYTGSTMAYVSEEEEGTKVHVCSSGDKVLPIEDISGLIAVSEKGEVYYTDSNNRLMVCSGKGESLISDSFDFICANLDYSQILTCDSEGFVIYEGGKTRSGTFGESGGIYEIILPTGVPVISYTNYTAGNKTQTLYHFAIGDFKQQYMTTADGALVRFDKDLNMEVISETVYDHVVSKDGKTLFWLDENYLVHKYNGSDSEFFCNEEGVYELYDWDETGKVLYYFSAKGEFAYSDGTSETVAGPYYPERYILGNDGYFYFKDGKALMAVKKGTEPFEVAECYSSGTSLSEEEFFSREGIGFKGSDKEIYFARNGEAVRLDTGENESIT